MKILLSSAGFFPKSFGGGEVYVYSLAKELLQRGHSVTVLTAVKWNGEKEFHKIGNNKFENIPVLSLNINPRCLSVLERNMGLGPSSIKILRKILYEFSPDIVHISGIKSALASVCNELGIPHVVTVHHMGIACPAGGLLRSDYSICDKPVNHPDCVPCCSYSRTPKWYTGRIIAKIPTMLYRRLGERLNARRNLSCLERGLIYLNNTDAKRNDYGKIL